MRTTKNNKTAAVFAAASVGALFETVPEQPAPVPRGTELRKTPSLKPCTR